MIRKDNSSALPQSPPPDRETDRAALEEERRRMIEEDRDEEWKKTGLEGGLKRLAEVLNKIKEDDDGKKGN